MERTQRFVDVVGFQFTHPGKGATLRSLSLFWGCSCFNSRTPGKGATQVCPCFIVVLPIGFNSRTLGRVRLNRRDHIPFPRKFQFTHPGKGATRSIVGWLFMRRFVSIHAPWEGCDHTQLPDSVTLPSFQFTHPGKGATRPRDHRRVTNQVSIHAPWEGCDKSVVGLLSDSWDVSIHAPWEGCDGNTEGCQLRELTFQFTHPGKGATAMPR